MITKIGYAEIVFIASKMRETRKYNCFSEQPIENVTGIYLCIYSKKEIIYQTAMHKR